MSGTAVPGQAPLTRRQIRELERAAEAAREAASGSTVAVPAGSATGELRAVRDERVTTAGPDDQAVTEVIAATAPRRRDLRAAQTPARTDGRRGWAPRAAVLGAMGALTIAAPLTGFAVPETTAVANTAVAPQTSLLTVLDESVAAAGAASGLMKDPAASLRAEILQTSRAVDRDALRCAPRDGASGARAAVVPEDGPDLVRPVADGTYRNSSPYGGRVDPITGRSSVHTGTDYAAELGTPIHAVADGVVEYVGPGKDGRSSMLVILKHEIDGETFYSWHVHMYADGIRVTAGQEVEAGDVIAEIGSNGRSTGPHLHFELHTDDEGTTVEPIAWLEQHGAVDVSELC